MSRLRAWNRPIPRLVAFGLLASQLLLGKSFAADGLLDKALAQPILPPNQVMHETADYVDSLVPKMPEVKSLPEWETYAKRTRAAVFERVIFRGEAAAWRDAKTNVEVLETIDGGPGYKIKKLRYEAVPGLWIPAILYSPTDLEMKPKGKVAAVLNVNGHDALGKAADYKQIRCINQAKRGLLALNVEWFNMGQLKADGFRHDLINHVDLTGTSGIALHYLAMSRALDLLLAIEQTDPERIAVTGLSGGGWQTIFISAFDTRVTLSNPVAGYSSDRTRVRILPDLGDSEQTPSDLAAVTDYAIMTAMMAPRPTLLTYNAKDQCCFAAPTALPPLIEAAGPVFRLYGKEMNLRSHINHDPGTHNYLLDNRQANYQMLADHFFAGDPNFDPKEIPSDNEVRTPEALNVPLPSDNADIQSIAKGLSKTLPVDASLPTTREPAQSWAASKREKLRELVHFKNHDAVVALSTEETADGIKAAYWRLNVGGWSVPVLELIKGEPKETVLLLADKGRNASKAVVVEQLDAGRRVLAVEPFYIGESRPADKDYLWALILASVGDRPLGLQAGEVASVARWAEGGRKLGPITLLTVGPRSSVIGLVASAIEEKAFAGIEVREPLGSLKELIETRADYGDRPELFGFGLLHDFDVVQLAALAAPRPLKVVGASPRGLTELAPLNAWQAVWGLPVEPVR